VHTARPTFETPDQPLDITTACRPPPTCLQTFLCESVDRQGGCSARVFFLAHLCYFAACLQDFITGGRSLPSPPPRHIILAPVPPSFSCTRRAPLPLFRGTRPGSSRGSITVNIQGRASSVYSGSLPSPNSVAAFTCRLHPFSAVDVLTSKNIRMHTLGTPLSCPPRTCYLVRRGFPARL
jgi:hypothetical protein